MRFVWWQRGSTSLGFQFGPLEVSFVYPRFWFWPRRHWITGRWEFPRIVRIHWWPKYTTL